MRSINVNELKPDMVLSRPLLGSDGSVLLQEGIAVRDGYIRYLRSQGIDTLFVDEPRQTPTTDFYDSEHTREALSAARQTVGQFRAGQGINLDRIKEIVSGLIGELSQKPENMAHFLDIRRKEEYLFSHAVNTCILSVMTGLALGYSADRLSELGLAAMLHDIGKIKFPQLLAKQFHGSLTPKERQEYRMHPMYSLELLQGNPSVSVAVANACCQHHERWNGSGYPLGLKGDAISEYAQIISVADVYDRLIVGLPHRLPVPVYYAAAILNKAAGEYFNPAIVETFTQNIAAYPMGKTVRLSNHQTGVILGTDVKNKMTPVVRITSGPDSSQLNRLVELDLKKNPGLFIVDFEEVYFNYAQAYADRAYVKHVRLQDA
ncbi:MAG: HD-GYP domain-containing protein [Sporomusaceae bacterium]|nr:HD-GYP domain-containing protein [Sporomusaceae bacterium]